MTTVQEAAIQRAATTGAASQAPGTEAPADESVRARLRRAAADVFSEKGYEGARVQEIARRAGLTTGAIYANYSGKSELLLDAIDEESDEEFEELLLQEGVARFGIDHFANLGSHLVTRPPEKREFLLFEAIVAARRDPDVARLIAEKLLDTEGTLRDVIDKARSKGDMAEDVDTDALVRLCTALSIGFTVFEALGVPHPDHEPWKALIDRLVGAVKSDDTGTDVVA